MAGHYGSGTNTNAGEGRHRYENYLLTKPNGGDSFCSQVPDEKHDDH
jgi:hypothetical protein